MCDYCNVEKYDEHYWKEDSLMKTIRICGYTELRFEYDNKTKKFSIVASGEDDVVANISYCPICGRKLEGE